MAVMTGPRCLAFFLSAYEKAQGEMESAAFSRLAFGVDRASMGFHYFLHDRQAEAAPRLFFVGRDAEEWLEDLVEIFRAGDAFEFSGTFF